MNLNATREEKNKLVLACLEDGLPFFPAYGLSMTWADGAYENAKARLLTRMSEDSICREDVWAEIVAGGDDLIFLDEEEADAENEDGMEVGRLNITNIDANWGKLLEKAPRSTAAYLDDNYDAGNTDVLIQILIFGEERYG